MSLGNSKQFVIYDSSNDRELIICNLALFARENKLNENCLRDVIKGRQTQHRGFYGKEFGDPLSLKDKHNKDILQKTSLKAAKLPISKQQRYNQSAEWVDFIANCKQYYKQYHIDQKLSCNKIGELFGVNGELVRLQFKKCNLKVIKYNNALPKGCKHYSYQQLNEKQRVLLDNFETLFPQYINDGLSVWEIAQLHDVCETTIHNYRRKYDVAYNSQNVSRPHKLVSNFLDTLNINYINNYRSLIAPKEVDIFMPDLNIAIEVNGVYWHSEDKVGKKYHLNKHLLCESKGVRLMQFFDDEILTKPDICFSIIRTAIGKNTKKIYARNTTVRKIDNKTLAKFIESNHIQGNRSASITYGLFDGDTLIQCMTFQKDKKYQYQLIRLCTKIDHLCIGGAEKLFSRFIKDYQPDMIVSYCDVRLFSGDVYAKLGFELTHTSQPNYYYFHDGDMTRKSRLQFQKHKLPAILSNYNETLTEWENMQINRYNRVWDCGNRVYCWQKQK